LVCWYLVAAVAAAAALRTVARIDRLGMATKTGLACAVWAVLADLALSMALGELSLSWWSLQDSFLLGLPACFVLVALGVGPGPQARRTAETAGGAKAFVDTLLPTPSQRHTVRSLASAAVGYVVLSFLMTYPGVTVLNTHAIGRGQDCWQMMWNLWWFREAVFSLHTWPYHCDLLFHPLGASLLLHSFQPWNGLLSSPLQACFGLVAAYNIVVLLNLAATGFAMYLLAHALTGRRGASFAAGCAFTFCANHMSHSLAHQNIASLGWLLIYCLAFLKTHARPGLGWPLLAGLSAVLATACSWYLLLFALLFSAIFYSYLLALEWRQLEWVAACGRCWRRLASHRERLWAQGVVTAIGVALSITLFAALPMVVRVIGVAAVLGLPWFAARRLGWRCAGRLAIAGGVAAIVLGPAAGLMLCRASEFEPGHEPWSNATDLAALFVPGAVSSYGPVFESVYRTFRARPVETGNYLGWTSLALAAVAWVAADRRVTRFWSLVGAVFIILSFGPKVSALGRPVFYGPYSPLRRGTIVLQIAGCPGRMAIMGSLALSAMVAYAVAVLSKRIGRPVLSATVLTTVVVLELLCLPFPATAARVPSFYGAMAQDEADYAVIDSAYSKNLFFQTIHRKKLMGGYLARRPRRALQQIWSVSLLNELLARPIRRTGRMFASDEDVEMLRSLNVRYIIDHSGRYRPVLKEQLGLRLAFQEDGADVYDIRHARKR